MPAMVAAVDAVRAAAGHLPNKDFTSAEDARKVAASGTKSAGDDVAFGAPVFGVFANDNKPRFRDGKDWPQSIVGGVRLGEEAGYMPVNARTVWDGRCRARLLYGHDLRPESRPRARTQVVQPDVLDERHGQDHGAEHGVVHPDGEISSARWRRANWPISSSSTAILWRATGTG
jgi:hypothetical protein